MSYIITDDKHYKDIANSIRSKMQTDREYYSEDMAVAIDNIPSSADGTDNPITGIYFLNPNEKGYPTKIKVAGFKLDNKEARFPLVFTDNIFKYVKNIEFINCDFKYFQDSAVKGCSSLTTVNLSDSLTSIGSTAFQDCSSLTTVNLPDSLISIGNYAFQYCSLLTTVNLPDSLISIGSAAFHTCSSLTTVNLPDSLTSIGSSAFNGCSSLTSINLPSSLTSIGSSVFYTCSSLKDVTLGDNFNCNNLDLSYSALYTRETILQWLNALADRTGQIAYKLIIGAKNLAKLTEEDILIATNKNWTLA